MLLFIVLIIIEVLSLIVLKEHWYNVSRPKFLVSIFIHCCLSLWLWFLLIKTIFYKGYFDAPGNIRMHLTLAGLVSAIALPRMLTCLFHYTGKLLRNRKGGHLRWLTRTGFLISFVVMSVIALGAYIGKFNFKTEKIIIKIKELDEGIDSLRIVHISDLHLATFYKHHKRLQNVVDKINRLNPDLIINTGDFISYGWREFDGFDTILSKAESRYGNFAILGNHDMGTYYPNSSPEERSSIAQKVTELAEASGYTVLNDENVIINIGGSDVAFIGVETYGRHPDIIHGDLYKAAEGTDSADLAILLAHDPNQWKKDVAGKTGIDLTLAGHTHGMQIGIVTKKFRWSPSKYYYPEWHGLFSEGDQYLYVNRGLGVMGVPFRIWMPPEITVITLVND